MGNPREILAGAVLDLHQREAAQLMKDERDEALKLLRRTLELREIGGEGPHKSDIRAFFVRLGEPVAMTRVARQQSLERAIVAFNPDTTEAVELLASFTRALIDRYGKARTMDLQRCLNDVEEALGEVEAELLKDGVNL
jgi:hypothetical protein